MLNRSLKDHNHLLEKLLMLEDVIFELFLLFEQLLFLFNCFEFLPCQIGQHEAYFHQSEDPLVHYSQHILF
jgi:hypothetical protein